MRVIYITLVAAVVAEVLNQALDDNVDVHDADSGHIFISDEKPETPVARGSTRLLKQVTLISDENRRLKQEITELNAMIADQSAEALAEKRKLVEAEIVAADARRKAAEAEAAVLAEKAKEAMKQADLILQEKLAAVEATEAARRTIEERRLAADSEARALEHKRIIAESTERKAHSEVEAAKVRLQQLELEGNIAGARATESLNTRLARQAELDVAIATAESDREKRLLQEAEMRMKEVQLTLEETQHRHHLIKLEKEFTIQKQLQEDESKRRQQELQLADELSRKREAEKQLNEEELEQKRAEEERKTVLARVEAEGAAKIKQERELEDIRLRSVAANAEAETAKWLKILQYTSTAAGSAFESFFQTYLVETLLGTTALLAAYFVMREAAIGTRKVLQRLIGQPSLVRDTSRSSGVAAFLRTLLCCTARNVVDLDSLKSGVVLPNDIMVHLLRVARSTSNARANGAPLRHVMFYGPPGTGKTLVAQKLAQSCGLDYAIMSGGDVAPLGAAAVRELDDLFRWAKASPKGLILFIDEAEAFLGSRKRANLSENLRNVLSTILHHTGSQSSSLMLILATNRPEDLDDAILDRVDDAVFFPEPGPEERVKLGRLYFHKYISIHTQFGHASSPEDPIPRKSEQMAPKGCCKAHAKAKIHIADDVLAAELDKLLQRADGFSGRQIAKLLLGMQAAAFGSDANKPTLSSALIKEVFAREQMKLTGLIKAEKLHYSTNAAAITSLNTTSSPDRSDGSTKADPVEVLAYPVAQHAKPHLRTRG